LDTARLIARRAPSLLALGLAVFVPLGLVDSAVDHVELHTGVDSVFKFAAVFAFVALQSASTLLGEVFYSGAVAGLVGDFGRYSLADTLRRLPYRRLILADLLFILGLVVSLMVLIVPGVLFFTWFGLCATLIEIEGLGVRDSFARSRELVRGFFWRVLLVLGVATFVSDALGNQITKGVHALLGHSFAATWAGESLGNVLTGPLYAVPAVLITMRLIERKRGA